MTTSAYFGSIPINLAANGATLIYQIIGRQPYYDSLLLGNGLYFLILESSGNLLLDQ